jgi:hypothetical protein
VKCNGKRKTQNGNSLIFPGTGENKEHRKEVGILMNKEAQKSILE